MKSGKRNKKNQSPVVERTTPIAGLHEQEIPTSPGRLSYKPSFLSRFLSSKSSSNPQEPLPPTPNAAGRTTPDHSERPESSDKKSRDNSPKSTSGSLASSTYRNLSQSFTDLANMASRSKPSSPDIEPISPSPISANSHSPELPLPDKPVQYPFRPESIQRQGWLNKRPDSDVKRPKAGATTNWKLQRAVVHDSRLYLYNPPSSLGIRAFSPSASPNPAKPNIKHTHSPSESTGLAAQATGTPIPSEVLSRRPSTAPQVFVKGKLTLHTPYMHRSV